MNKVSQSKRKDERIRTARLIIKKETPLTCLDAMHKSSKKQDVLTIRIAEGNCTAPPVSACRVNNKMLYSLFIDHVRETLPPDPRTVMRMRDGTMVMMMMKGMTLMPLLIVLSIPLIQQNNT